MLIKKKRHIIPGLNTTSTSDISFMLLIFFLVTTSMDSDKGMGRQLPPIDPEEQLEIQDIDRQKVLAMHLMKGGQLTVNDAPTHIDNALRKDIRHFIIEKGSTHIIELQVDRDADYASYFKLQNQIVTAYREIRDGAAMKQYGKAYAKCNEEQREAIGKAYPQRITEPKPLQ